MPTLPDVSLERREFLFRAEAIDAEKREITGIAVPFDTDANIGGYYVERFAPGSVQDSSDALLFWRHSDPIGKLTEDADEAAGWKITARVSETSLGTDALTLARDGVVTQLSVGFEAGGEYEVTERADEIPIITRTRVRVREVSLVPFGAYADAAQITEVRENPTQRKETAPMTVVAPEDLTEVRESIETLERRFATLDVTDHNPVADTRSVGEIVQALAAGDESTITRYNELQARAYTGGTSADSPVKDAWVGDLTRIFDASSGVLASIFADGTLPAQGNNVEYAELATNTVQVTQQAAEGDDLAFGKVTLAIKTAPVLTYGGYTQLTRQEIERSTLPILNRSLEALTVAAGIRAKAALRARYDATYTAQSAIAANAGVILLGATLAAATITQWTASIVEAAIRFEALGFPIERLVVSKSVFLKFDSFADSAGRPLFDRTSTGSNAVGTLSLPGLTGNLSGITVVLDSGATDDKAAFVNGAAIRHYKSALVSLQGENIVNLSKDFSAYRYGAVAAEIPSAIVPVKLAAI